MAQLLDGGAVAAALGTLSGWSGDESAIRREVRAPTFLAGIALVDAVARAAEAADHHPDIDIRWRTVTFTLSTHSAGGVTAKDLALAATIDGLVRESERAAAEAAAQATAESEADQR
jgi:4a-hydroxytetrahydrobiopterin dehydratase